MTPYYNGSKRNHMRYEQFARMILFNDMRPEPTYELFSGSGAASYLLARKKPGMVYSTENNHEMVLVLRAIKEAPFTLRLKMMGYDNSSESYSRSNMIASDPTQDSIERAAAIFVRQQMAYGGVYRKSKKGHNVPYTNRKKLVIPSFGEMIEMQSAFRQVDFHYADWRQNPVFSTNFSLNNTVVYADPPYYGSQQYDNNNKFTEQDQQELADAMLQLSKRGASVFISNSDRPEVREMYFWAHLYPITKGTVKNKITELFISNQYWKDLL